MVSSLTSQGVRPWAQLTSAASASAHWLVGLPNVRGLWCNRALKDSQTTGSKIVDDDGSDSLEATIQQHNTPHSLPIFTLANDQRVLRDRLYAEAIADWLLEFLFDIDNYRGTGRLYLPQ